MLRIDRAIQATTSVEPGKLALGESQAGPATRTLSIRNDSGADVMYDLTHAPALSTGPNTFTPSFVTGFATVSFSANPVIVPAGSVATVDVTITANTGLADRSLYGGYIVITPRGGEAVRVPYSGFKGDYQSIQVVKPTVLVRPDKQPSLPLPWLATLVGDATKCPAPNDFVLLDPTGVLTSGFCNRSSGATFTLKDGDVPYVVAHLDHESRLVRMEVRDALTGKDWHRALELPYFARNGTATSFFGFSWDGVTVAGNRLYTVPNGKYQIVLTVIKALGDGSNPADVETWTSAVITIARP
jgi:hypothetical protein